MSETPDDPAADGDRLSFPGVIAFAVVGGIVLGVLDLWIDSTLRMFMAGIAAGVAFLLFVSVVIYLTPRSRSIVKALVWCVGGAVGGVAWWLVARPEAVGLLVSALAGLGAALIWLVAEGGLRHAKSGAV